MAEIAAVCVADLADLVTNFNFSACFQDLLKMTVQRLDFGSVGQSVSNNDDVSPAGACVFGKDYLAVGDGVNGFAAISIAAGIFVPILAKMAVGSEIQGVIPIVLAVFCLREFFTVSQRI